MTNYIHSVKAAVYAAVHNKFCQFSQHTPYVLVILSTASATETCGLQ
jgi:hypothetical protein